MSENGIHKIPAMRAALVAIQELHDRTYVTASDEVYERNAICTDCHGSWPCDTRKLADEGLTDRMARTNQGENNE